MELQAKKAKNIATINIGGQEYEIFLAKTEKQKERGFQGFKSLPKNEGMLFFLNEESPVETFFHMHNVGMPLDLIFLDEDMKVLDVKQGNPEDDRIEGKGSYVLEVNVNSGIKPGDEAELDDDDTDYVMEMLAPDGSIQFKLEGGERIFSRKSTKVMIRKAIKAEQSKEDKDYKALGKYILKEIYNQDHRDPEYVQNPNKT